MNQSPTGDAQGCGRRRALPRLWLAAAVLPAMVLGTAARGQVLPEAPSAVLGYALPAAGVAGDEAAAPGTEFQAAGQVSGDGVPYLPPCEKIHLGLHSGPPQPKRPVVGQTADGKPCMEENPLQAIVTTQNVAPLTSQQKGYLAVRDIIDPFNLITIVGYAGINIAANSHTAYGPGLKGFGRLTGYSMVEDMQGEFFGTYAIPSLVHEDPRYHRMPGRPIALRILHAVGHTVLSQHDDGSLMLNIATLATYPISAELSNLYVPGVAVNAPSTARRIALGLATDPAGAVVAEFLPDVAKRIHIRIVFVQQILQQVAVGAPNTQ